MHTHFYKIKSNRVWCVLMKLFTTVTILPWDWNQRIGTFILGDLDNTNIQDSFHGRPKLRDIVSRDIQEIRNTSIILSVLTS